MRTKLLKIMDVLWGVRIILLTIFGICTALFIYLFAFVRQPLLAEILPYPETKWFIGTEVPNTIKHNSIDNFISKIYGLFDEDVFEMRDDYKASVDNVAYAQFQEAAVMIFSPKRKNDLWEIFHLEFKSLPLELLPGRVMSFSSDTTSGFMLWHEGYFWISNNSHALMRLTDNISSIADQKNYFNSRRYHYRKNAIEGYISLQSLSLEVVNILDDEKKEIFDSLIPKTSEDQSIVFEGSYTRSGNINIVSYSQQFNKVNKYKYFTTPAWIKTMNTGVLQLSGSNFMETFNKFLSENYEYRPYFEMYSSYLQNTIDFDLPTTLIKVLNKPYVFRLDQDDSNVYQASLMLVGSVSDDDLSYIRDGFFRFVVGLEPVVKNILLPDGTKGSEYIVDIDQATTTIPISIEGFSCQSTQLEDKTYEWSFVICKGSDVVLISTSENNMKQMISDIEYFQNGYTVEYEDVFVSGEFIDDLVRQELLYEEIPLMEMVHIFKNINIHTSSTNHAYDIDIIVSKVIEEKPQIEINTP